MPSPASTRCCTRWLLKARHQIVKNPLGPLPHVEAVLKLAEVFRQALLRDPDVRATDRPFQDQPKGFDVVGMIRAPHIFLRPMVDLAVGVAHGWKDIVDLPFVDADMRSRCNVVDDVGQHFLAAGVLHDAGDDLAFALDHPEHDSLLGTATGKAVLPAASKTGPVSDKYKALVGDHDAHPGTGLGPGAARRAV